MERAYAQIPGWADQVGLGWAHLLEDLHVHLSVLDPHYKIADLKEKFGALRIYIDVVPEHRLVVDDLVWKAETASCGICEFCGNPGVTRPPAGKPHGWKKTTCDTHHELRSNE